MERRNELVDRAKLQQGSIRTPTSAASSVHSDETPAVKKEDIPVADIRRDSNTSVAVLPKPPITANARPTSIGDSEGAKAAIMILEMIRSISVARSVALPSRPSPTTQSQFTLGTPSLSMVKKGPKSAISMLSERDSVMTDEDSGSRTRETTAEQDERDQTQEEMAIDSTPRGPERVSNTMTSTSTNTNTTQPPPPTIRLERMASEREGEQEFQRGISESPLNGDETLKKRIKTEYETDELIEDSDGSGKRKHDGTIRS